MEHSGNISIFNFPGILFRNIPQNFIGNIFQIFREHIMAMFYKYSTNIYLSGGMQSQMELGQKKFIKFEIKKGGSKEETSNN